jgi:hypothetical protein
VHLLDGSGVGSQRGSSNGGEGSGGFSQDVTDRQEADVSSTIAQTALIVIKKLRVAVARVRFVQFVSSAVVSGLKS